MPGISTLKIRDVSCICVCEPRGLNGLEGFTLDDTYKAERMQTKSDAGVKDYYRVYPKYGNYYETCGPNVFTRYFKEL